MQKNWLRKWREQEQKAYLVNTGWNGTGKRISIKDTAESSMLFWMALSTKPRPKTIPFFNFEVPTALPGVDPKILTFDTYSNANDWETKAKTYQNVSSKTSKFEGNEAGKALVAAGPKL